MQRNESGGIEILKDLLREKAVEAGRTFKTYPVGPQDKLVLADDIFATAHYFAIVESKWSENELASEADGKTDRVARLCKGLANDPRMAQLHAKCHKIAWRDSVSGETMLQPYREAICRESHVATCAAVARVAPLGADLFADEFFGLPPDHCLEAADFMAYVTWLLQTVTRTSGKAVMVLTRDTSPTGTSISVEVTLPVLAEKLKADAVKREIAKRRGKATETNQKKGPRV